MATQRETEQFKAVLPTLLDYISGPDLMNDDVAEARKWFRKALEYTNTNVYPFYGQMVVTFYKQICPQCSPEQLQLARVLGWCVEIWKNAGLMADDVVDGQLMREGKPTWFTCKDVGRMICVDCGIYFFTVTKLMKKYFGKLPYYSRLFEYLTECTLLEIAGARMDAKINWKEFTSEKCETLTKVKSNLYMYIPMLAAMLMSGITEDQDYHEVEQICKCIGRWQQDQNDYLDFYGAAMGTDIPEGRCTWMFGRALKIASETQLETIQNNYGRTEPECMAAITNLYLELDLKSVFAEHQRSRHNEAKALIDKYRGAVPKELFFKFLKDMDDFRYV